MKKVCRLKGHQAAAGRRERMEALDVVLLIVVTLWAL